MSRKSAAVGTGAMLFRLFVAIVVEGTTRGGRLFFFRRGVWGCVRLREWGFEKSTRRGDSMRQRRRGADL